MMLDRRGLLLAGAAGIAQIGQHAQPRVTAPQLLRQSHIPAVGSAIVKAHGPPAIAVEGRRRANRGEGVSVDDLWLVGANTQAMTAVLYAKMVEANRANWRARTPELFPDLKPHAAWAEITVEDLMSHQSGVSDVPVATADFLAEAAVDTRPLVDQRTAFAKLILSQPPPGDVGRFAYASANYVLVGAAIERAAKMAWETAISGELFTPLGLTTAGFGAPTGPQPWGHQMLGTRALPIDPKGVADDPPVFGPAARVHLTLNDYAAFVRLFLSGGGDYLTQDSLRRLVDPRSDSGEGPALGWTVSAERGWAKGPVLSDRTSGGFWSCDVAIGQARGLAVITVGNAGGEQGGAATERLLLTLIQQNASA